MRQTALAEKLQLDRSTVSRRVRKALDGGRGERAGSGAVPHRGVHRTSLRGAVRSALGARQLRRSAPARPAQLRLQARGREDSEGPAGPKRADDARGPGSSGAAQGARALHRRRGSRVLLRGRRAPWTTTATYVATRTRSSGLACARSGSTIFATPSARRRSRHSIPTRCRATWATSTTRPPSATSITSRGATMRRGWRRPSGGSAVRAPS